MELLKALQGRQGLRTLCIVPSQECVEPDCASLGAIPLRDAGTSFRSVDEDARLAAAALVGYAPVNAVVGHDVITGDLAIEICRLLPGSRKILICHMAYGRYVALMRDSLDAKAKEEMQRALFAKADNTFAVGPLLLEELEAFRRSCPEMAQPKMLMPPLLTSYAPTTPRTPPRLLFVGRIEAGNDSVKQARLAAEAFGRALREPSAAIADATVDLYGFEEDSPLLKEFMALINKEAGFRVPVRCLHFDSSRERMLSAVADATVVVMPSVHEGFGLVAWEAMCLGVPVVVSTNSGFYKFVDSMGFASLVGAITIREYLDSQAAEAQLSALAKIVRERIEFPERFHKLALRLLAAIKQGDAISGTIEKFLAICGYEPVSVADAPVDMGLSSERVASKLSFAVEVNIGLDEEENIKPELVSTLRKTAVALRAIENGVGSVVVDLKSAYLERLKEMSVSHPDEDIRLEAAVNYETDAPKLAALQVFLEHSLRLLASKEFCNLGFESEGRKAEAFAWLVSSLRHPKMPDPSVSLDVVGKGPGAHFRIYLPRDEVESMSFYVPGFTIFHGVTAMDFWYGYSPEIAGAYLLSFMRKKQLPVPMGNLDDWRVGTP